MVLVLVVVVVIFAEDGCGGVLVVRAAAESSSQWFVNTIVNCGGNGFACTCTRLHMCMLDCAR